MSDLIKGQITIAEIGVEEKRIKLSGEDRKVFSIWKEKQDGNTTVAYQAFEPHFSSAQGKTFDIAYDEKPNPKSPGTFFRSIKMLKLGVKKDVSPDGQPATISCDLDMRLSNIEARLKAIDGKESTPTPIVDETPLKTSNTASSSDSLAVQGEVKVETSANGEVNVENIPF